MKRRLLLLLLGTSLVFCAIASYSRDFLVGRGDVRRYGGGFHSPARRLLMSDVKKRSDTALVASLDGTIYLLEVGSMIPLWSFSSGSQIYSSYQAPINDGKNGSGIEINYFIDCGDDWELYAHNSFGKLKLMKTLEEYITSTPQITEDGGVVLGFRKTSGFLVDATSGKVIHKYSMTDPPSVVPSGVNDFPYNTTIEEQYQSRPDMKIDKLPPLYITRTDYTLASFSPNSDRVLWNLTVAEIGAAFLCQDVDNSIGSEVTDIDSSEPDLPYKMPLPCQSRALVYRFRDHIMLEAFSLPPESPTALDQDMMLPAPTADALPSQPNVWKVLELITLPGSNWKLIGTHQNTDIEGVLPLNNSNEANGDKNRSHGSVLSVDYSGALHNGASRFILLFSILLVLVGYGYHYWVVSRMKLDLASESSGMNPMSTQSKRRKSRKTGKSRSNWGRQDKENDIQFGQNMTVSNFWLKLSEPPPFNGGGRTIGKLIVSNKEIAIGSNGTIVLEGVYEGRHVAVKRLVRACNDIAFKEIQNLIVSDHHPNIVRWYGVEQDQDFVYLALERCACSLNELVHLKSSVNASLGKKAGAVFVADPIDFVQGFMQDFELWNQRNSPSPLMFKLMRDIISGVVHLHELGIVHRDLKPQNVLIISDNRSLCAKLSDMGISKRLIEDMSSFSNHATGCGSSGWQAPEQLLHGRQTRSVDLFSLGCLLFFCITGGKHPFGDNLERDVNIAKSKVDLFPVEHFPEAVDVISRLLDPNADVRPKALEVLNHPLFWNAEARLSFLRDTSDRVELEDREGDSDLLKSLENIAPDAFGVKWSEKMESSFLNNIGRYRRYKFDSVRDLLRVMRNKLNHYRELPAEIQVMQYPVLQEIIGPVPEGFDMYFRSRYPKLLIEVHKVMLKYCRTEECFHKYFDST